MLIDSHCHIHDLQFFSDDREAVYKRAIGADVRMILVGTSGSDSQAAVEFAAAHEGTWAAIGVHPHEAISGWDAVNRLASPKGAKLVAIGEIGLDYHYAHSPREVQIEAMEAQIELALDLDLPIIFHVRDAFDDFWPIIDGFHGIRGVLHSFTDTEKNLEEGLRRGLLIGVNGISTFTKDPAQQAMFRAIPLEKLLLETDAPYLTPVPFRGRVNEPAFVREVAKHQAAIMDRSFGDIAAISTANAEALFALR